MAYKLQYVNSDWQSSPEGKDVMTALFHRNSEKRKIFGLLGRPSFPSNMSPDLYTYKVFVSGRSGVGKTSTICRLAGSGVPTVHSETQGLQTTVVYWPASVADNKKVVMFQLQFCDAGENAMKKYDHIFTACKLRADAVLFLFSFTDKSSFTDLPHQMSRVLEPADDLCNLVIGTKFDLHAEMEVSQQEVRDFETRWKLPVLKVCNTTDHKDNLTDLSNVAPILNSICDKLWHRDQLIAEKTEGRDQVYV